jgi:hypothetical protein
MVIERIGPVPAVAGGAWCAVPFPAGAPAAPGPGIRAGISLAAAGDMGLAVRGSDPSFGRILATLGVETERVRSVRQVHSRTVVHADGQGWPSPWADGIVTRDPGLLLTVTVADCLPLFLLDSVSGAFAVVHSGWKGTGIVVEALRLMAGAFATRPADVWAAIGPGIGPCCYEVPAERCGEFRARFGGRCVRDGSRLDLREANLALLEEEGIAGVSVADECTACSSRLGSFRRQAAGHPAGQAQFTRMLAFIGSW